jgi:hypothetical protein
LTLLGRYLLNEGSLSPQHALVLRLLETGSDLRAIEKMTPNSEYALGTVAALLLLSAASVGSTVYAFHSLLVRKHRQVRASATPIALLDLPAGAAPAQARRALRRLAAQLHPDSLGPDAPSALRQASCDVINALVHAETQLRLRKGA